MGTGGTLVYLFDNLLHKTEELKLLSNVSVADSEYVT